jgi:gamma-glutamyl-gamma-aminobutyraldehyde dehydrogenase
MKQAEIDGLRAAPVAAAAHFIDGRFRPSRDGATLASISPIDGRKLADLADGGSAEIDLAAAAARRAYEGGAWSRRAPAQRKKTLLAFADLVEKNALELAVLGSRDNGTEIGMALKAEPMSAATTLRWYAEAIDKIYGEIAPTAPETLALVHREPLGVIGAIVPWNFPLMIGAWKIGPALAAGNSVVVKPSEIASLTLLRLAELGAAAGLPDGVLNVVTGQGAAAGAALASHMDVNALVFTGSGGTGRRLVEASARSNLKRVHLELGGKSANIVFADAPDLKTAAKVAAQGVFRNAGQVCVAGSRLLVERAIYSEFIEEVAKAALALRVGDPLRLETDVGAVASEGQLLRNLEFVAGAQAEGARRVCGGERLLDETGGYYMAPTIFADVAPTARLFQEEVFGPVLAVTPFDDEAEAIRLANATPYGLAGAVWTSNLSRAHRMVRAVRAGVVHVNAYGGADVTVPLGGFGQSGFGRDKSLHAFDAYTDLKTAWIAL